jgi:stage II sporulation protein D
MGIILFCAILFSFVPAKAASGLHYRPDPVSSMIRVRLFAGLKPDYAILTIISGQYNIGNGSGRFLEAGNGEMIIIARHNGKTVVKIRNGESLSGDSVDFKGQTGEDRFSVRVNQQGTFSRSYNGDLLCFNDMGSLFLINIIAIEKYIAGVVKAEGGGGKYEEYFKTQAIIARTYTYKYLGRHILDKYNLCDDTHCQAFNGSTVDTLIINAVNSTSGMVIVTPDSSLIISGFHSNCGGETSPSEYAWTEGQSYLKGVSDPYCRNSPGALWERKISTRYWRDYLRKNGLNDSLTDPSVFNFIQNARVADYVTGSFTMPLRTIRNDLDLRSTFFSVSADKDFVTLKGRGYGHGVGLCQEGAMIMASMGFTCQQIIDFYYSGVLITDIKNAVILHPNNPPVFQMRITPGDQSVVPEYQ